MLLGFHDISIQIILKISLVYITCFLDKVVPQPRQAGMLLPTHRGQTGHNIKRNVKVPRVSA